jgi:hypothetical protein
MPDNHIIKQLAYNNISTPDTNHLQHQHIHLTFDKGERSRTGTVEDLLLPEKKEGYGSGTGAELGEKLWPWSSSH